MFEQIFQALEFAIKKKIQFAYMNFFNELEIRAIIVNMNRKQAKSKLSVHSLYVLEFYFIQI